MTKAELIAEIADGIDSTKAQVAEVLKAFETTVTDLLQCGDKLTLPGFLTLSVKKRAARTGRNPRTGEPLKIKAATVVSAKAGSQLKLAVNTTPKKSAKRKSSTKGAKK